MSYWNVPIHPVVVPVLSLLEAAFFALGGLCLGWSDGYNPHRSGRGTREVPQVLFRLSRWENLEHA